MKDFQKKVFDSAILHYKKKNALVKSAVILDKVDDYFYRVAMSIAEVGTPKEGFYLAWVASVSISEKDKPNIVLYEKDWTPAHRVAMKNTLNSVIDGVGDPVNSYFIDKHNILMIFRLLTPVERGFFL